MGIIHKLSTEISNQIAAGEVVERMDCAECDRHVEFRIITGEQILFFEAHMRNLLAELCKNCCGAEDAPYENNAERVYDNYIEGN